MVIYNFLFILFFFFTHKQSYSGTHFTGSSKVIQYFIAAISIINTILEFSYLVYFAITNSFINAIILLIASFLIMYILNTFICKLVMLQAKKEINVHDPFFYSYYNRKCDIFATITAIIGAVINIIIAIVYIKNIFFI